MRHGFVSGAGNLVTDIGETVVSQQEFAAFKETAEGQLNRIDDSMSELSETTAAKLERSVVSALPSSTLDYDFEDGETHFTNASKMTAAITEGVQGISVTSAVGTSSIARGYIDLSAVTNGADSITIEYDSYLSPDGNRMWIGIVDLDERPGASSGTNYTGEGVVFKHGTANGSTYYINGHSYSSYTPFLNSMVHVKAVIDLNAQTVSYSLSNSSAALSWDNQPFVAADSGLTVSKVTGIEFYSWLQGSAVQIDNIHVTARTDAKENVLYMVPDGSGNYIAYMYVDGEPIPVGRSDSVGETDNSVNYSTVPQRIGTWIDGTPVWRQAFEFTFTEANMELVDKSFAFTPSIYDQSYCYVINRKGYVRVFDTPCMIDDIEAEAVGQLGIYFDIPSGVIPYLENDCSGAYGWVEFATPESNIKT